jgi:hypothetical protein
MPVLNCSRVHAAEEQPQPDGAAQREDHLCHRKATPGPWVDKQQPEHRGLLTNNPNR